MSQKCDYLIQHFFIRYTKNKNHKQQHLKRFSLTTILYPLILKKKKNTHSSFRSFLLFIIHLFWSTGHGLRKQEVMTNTTFDTLMDQSFPKSKPDSLMYLYSSSLAKERSLCVCSMDPKTMNRCHLGTQPTFLLIPLLPLQINVDLNIRDVILEVSRIMTILWDLQLSLEVHHI